MGREKDNAQCPIRNAQCAIRNRGHISDEGNMVTASIQNIATSEMKGTASAVEGVRNVAPRMLHRLDYTVGSDALVAPEKVGIRLRSDGGVAPYNSHLIRGNPLPYTRSLARD